jgi:serine/threonine protein kinase
VVQPTKREGAGSPDAAARFEPAPGMVVAGKYRVERVLGEGGMGVVVAATHLGLDQPVAIKFLHAEAMRDRDSVERFLREAKVAAMVKNDHVARVHDVGSLEDGAPYIVMEHLEGSDLGDLIDLGGPLAIDEACEVALQACAALAEVHAAGIVHRDLKPSNLFVTRRSDGSPAVKLLDFGISKLSAGPGGGGQDPALTATATIMGSPSYMSPEQLKSTKEVDARTDLWSLGAVLYEAVTGKPAFRGENVPQVCAMIASEEPAAPSTLREGVPPELERAILGCLVKKPDERITLVELSRALAKLAPERAAGLLDRIEATADPAQLEAKGRAPSSSSSGSGAGTVERDEPRAAAATGTAGATGAKVVATAPSVERAPGSRGSALATLVLVGGAGVLAGALYTGRLQRPALRQGVVGASGAVVSAASAVSAAASAVASAVASSLPDLPPLPDPLAAPVAPAASTAPSASAASAEGAASDEPDDALAIAPRVTVAPAPASAAAPAAAPMAAASHPAARPVAPAPPAAPKPHTPKPHHAAKPLHKAH